MGTVIKKTDVSAKTTSSEAEYIARIVALEATVVELTKTVDKLTEQNKWLTLKLFGPKREKRFVQVENQISFFNEAEREADESKSTSESEFTSESEQEEEPQTVPAAARKRKKRSARFRFPDNIPVERIEYKLSPEECNCPGCGGSLHVINQVIREELKIIQPQFIKVEHVTYKYGCRHCEKTGEHSPITLAPTPDPVIKGGIASPEAVAHIIVQKFVYGVPLYRQEQGFNRAGLELSRQTMANWIIKAARDWIEPVRKRLRRLAISRDILHADETGVQVLKEDGRDAKKKSYMWLFRTGCDAEKPIVLYHYEPSRAGDVAAEFLGDCCGYLHTDGYAAYQSKLSKSIILVACWAHARRKFHDAVIVMPKNMQSGSPANKGLTFCNDMFELERKFKDLPNDNNFNARYEARLKELKPLMDEFFAWAEEIEKTNLPKSGLGKAVGYAMNLRSRLEAVLLDGRLEFSNNRAERSIKPFVIGRKNWLFCNTPSGAEASASIYSLVETAKENGIDPYKYLLKLFQTAPNSTDSVESLLPWNLCGS